MKKILGLDLGAASIGWAVIQENNDTTTILGLGSRIIPYDDNEGRDFEKGAGESKNSLRTKARTARKGYNRYQLRRKLLVNILLKNGMFPTEQIKALEKAELWKLRAIAPNQQISLPELGRILLWLNQKRGYKSSRADANLDKKDRDYVSQIKTRHQEIKKSKQTIGQYFYDQLLNDTYSRIKEQIFPREAYIEEYDAIIQCQKQYHPILTDDLTAEIRNEIIYYQRCLKSQKGLVSVCEFEGREYNGHLGGPKVAPKSSPLSQLTKIWESVNNIKVADQDITNEQKRQLFDYLNQNEKISEAKLKSLLSLSKDARLNSQLKKGLNGNKTYSQIASCFGDKIQHYKDLLSFEPQIVENDTAVFHYDKKTGEVKGEKRQKYVSEKVENEPYHRLWHTIYSIQSQEECKVALVRNFSIDEDVAEKLASLDLTVGGFGNKSAKVIRKILPYLMDGDMYSVAMDYAGYNHSSASLTSQENISRTLEDSLKLLPKNSLRQPIVEKILNQMINLVNSIIEHYGRPDEVRVELARELKQSKDERSETDTFIRKRECENNEIKKSLEQYGLRDTRNNVIKWRLYHEINDQGNKLNASCIYCGQPIPLTQAILGNEVDIEHIIPKSKLFDDSQTNKTLAHRKCNSGKDDRTAYDFMKSKTSAEFEAYVERVEELYKKHLISGAKRTKLLMSEDKIPNDFIERQLRESQYIASKSREILQSISRNVWCTSGSVTAYLRKLWGWDDVTMNLQLPIYKELGMTELVEWESDHGANQHSKEVIKDWNKRNDHRHHAIDALVVACTKQGYIQRLNTLNADKTKDEMYNRVIDGALKFNQKRNLLEKYFITEQPLTTTQVEKAVSAILISFKAGKKAATIGTRKIGKRGNKHIVQSGIIIPRGALSEESVYGKIMIANTIKPIKFLFENPHLIYKAYIRKLVEERLAKFDGDQKKALSTLKKEPIYLRENETLPLEWARCYNEECVIKYKVNVDFNKIDKVIDNGIKSILESRLAKFGGQSKEAFKDVETPTGETIPWWKDEGLKQPILSVRCLTGLSAVVPVKKDVNGNNIGFVKPGNNHHVALYLDENGVRQESVTTFWHAVERKKAGIPTIITSPNDAWNNLPEGVSEEFLSQLPQANWTFEVSLQQNEMFILGLEPEAFDEAMYNKDYALLSKYLYRVQSLSEKNYWFRLHLETANDKTPEGKVAKKYYLSKSIDGFIRLHPQKVRISLLGEITKI